MRQCLVLRFTAHPGSGRVGSVANSSTEKALASFHSLLLCNLFPLPLSFLRNTDASFICCQVKGLSSGHVPSMFSTEIPCDSPSSGQSSMSQYFPRVVHKPPASEQSGLTKLEVLGMEPRDLHFNEFPT